MLKKVGCVSFAAREVTVLCKKQRPKRVIMCKKSVKGVHTLSAAATQNNFTQGNNGRKADEVVRHTKRFI